MAPQWGEYLMACELICSVPACKYDHYEVPHCEAGLESMSGRLCWEPAAHHKMRDNEETFVCHFHKED